MYPLPKIDSQTTQLFKCSRFWDASMKLSQNKNLSKITQIRFDIFYVFNIHEVKVKGSALNLIISVFRSTNIPSLWSLWKHSIVHGKSSKKLNYLSLRSRCINWPDSSLVGHLKRVIFLHRFNDILNDNIKSRHAQEKLNEIVKNEGFANSIQDPHAANERHWIWFSHIVSDKSTLLAYSLRWMRDLAIVEGDSLRQYCLPPSIVFLR